jgi:uncharacterized protein
VTEYAVICGVALIASALTLFSGFGLGTVLMPLFAVFFPVEVAIAATAVVHLANDSFKVALLGRNASRAVVVWFGVPAVVAAFAGAWVMLTLAGTAPLATYSIPSLRVHGSVEPIKLVIAALLVLFALLELSRALQRLDLPRAMLPMGGLLSGFFGGLAGMQGALRSAFLVRAGLTRDQFIASAAVISVGVDLTRLLVYMIGASPLGRMAPGLARLGNKGEFGALREPRTLGLLVAACLAAFVGSFFGARLVRKVTMRTVQRIVAGMLLVLAGMLASGLI